MGDHVELRFVPPPHERSLRGRLAREIRRRPKGRLDRAKAWAEAARAKVRRTGS